MRRCRRARCGHCETIGARARTIVSIANNRRSYAANRNRSSQRSNDHFRLQTKRLSRNLKRLSPEGRRGPSPKRGKSRCLLRLGGFSHRRRRLARSTHPPDRLTRRKNRALGAARAVKRLQPGAARAELLSYRGSRGARVNNLSRCGGDAGAARGRIRSAHPPGRSKRPEKSSIRRRPQVWSPIQRTAGGSLSAGAFLRY